MKIKHWKYTHCRDTCFEGAVETFPLTEFRGQGIIDINITGETSELIIHKILFCVCLLAISQHYDYMTAYRMTAKSLLSKQMMTEVSSPFTYMD